MEHTNRGEVDMVKLLIFFDLEIEDGKARPVLKISTMGLDNGLLSSYQSLELSFILSCLTRLN